MVRSMECVLPDSRRPHGPLHTIMQIGCSRGYVRAVLDLLSDATRIIMLTREIARKSWREQLDAFSTIHEGWLVSLDVVGSNIGAQPEIDSLPLLGVSADRLAAGGTITISVASSPRSHLTHLVHDVAHLYVEETDDGADAALAIEEADGTRHVLRFRAPARPETVDGFAHDPLSR